MTSSPTIVRSLVLERGHLIEVAGSGSGRVLGIEQLTHDQFELTIDEMRPDGTITVKSARNGRLVDDQALLLEEGDVVTIPGIGSKQVGAITRIREGRYRFRLEEKYVPSIVVDINMSAPPL